MSKRFTDTEKFNDPWYRRLTLLEKVIWEYLLAECNHAGIFEKFDIELMSFKIGESITLENLDFLKDRIIFINKETIFIRKFITFQYGTLNPRNKVHASVLKELEKWKIQGPSKDLVRPLQGSKNKDKDKDKDKDKNKDKDNINKNINEKKSKDIFCNVDFQKCFELYEKHCTDLLPLGYAKRNKEVLNLLSDFLEEIEYNFEYFENLCVKANELKIIVKTKIDFKMMIKNHDGIMQGKYIKEVNEPDLLSMFDFD